ncbi:hypothetical protein [Arthrobacter sp. H14]|uniref:hypothetical protein n=1 Tax=Arthrobacter sp. H14 TaxID=1312959 RepID=UPI00047EE1C6|nr:hypothetical protein [Arthrobacter sp. H14]
MEWIIWILVIIAVVAIVIWMLRKNSGPTSGGSTPEQRHPGNQPGSGANEPIVEAGPPVSNTPAAGTAGAGAAGSVTAAGAERDTNAATANDERWQSGSSDPVDRPTAPDRGAQHTTAADGTVDDTATGRGAVPPAGQEDDHNAMGRHNLGEDRPGEGDDDSLGAANIGEDQPGDPDYDSLGSSNIGGPDTEGGHHSLGSHNLGEGDDAVVEDPTPTTRREARQDAEEHQNDVDRDKGTP